MQSVEDIFIELLLWAIANPALMVVYVLVIFLPFVGLVLIAIQRMDAAGKAVLKADRGQFCDTSSSARISSPSMEIAHRRAPLSVDAFSRCLVIAERPLPGAAAPSQQAPSLNQNQGGSGEAVLSRRRSKFQKGSAG